MPRRSPKGWGLPCPPLPPHHRQYVILLPSQKAQHGVSTLLRHCFEWLWLHIVPISRRCVVAKNRRCESSRVTWAFSLRGSRRFCWGEGRNFEDTRACSLRLFRSIVSNRRVCFILKTETGICAKRCSQTYGS